MGREWLLFKSDIEKLISFLNNSDFHRLEFFIFIAIWFWWIIHMAMQKEHWAGDFYTYAKVERSFEFRIFVVIFITLIILGDFFESKITYLLFMLPAVIAMFFFKNKEK